MSKMVAKATYRSTIQEATQIVKHYELAQSGTQHWACEVCGMMHSGPTPTSCDSCGSSGFVQEDKTSSEIGTRW